MTPSMNLCQFRLDCTSMEETIRYMKDQDFVDEQKKELHQIVCRLETISTLLRSLT